MVDIVAFCLQHRVGPSADGLLVEHEHASLLPGVWPRKWKRAARLNWFVVVVGMAASNYVPPACWRLGRLGIVVPIQPVAWSTVSVVQSSKGICSRSVPIGIHDGIHDGRRVEAVPSCQCDDATFRFSIALYSHVGCNRQCLEQQVVMLLLLLMIIEEFA